MTELEIANIKLSMWESAFKDSEANIYKACGQGSDPSAAYFYAWTSFRKVYEQTKTVQPPPVKTRYYFSFVKDYQETIPGINRYNQEIFFVEDEDVYLDLLDKEIIEGFLP